jgi:T4 superinfection immunity protein
MKEATRHSWVVAGNAAWYTLLVLIHIATLGLFVPWWVAIRRRVPNTGSIIVIDIFLGWTLVGWVVAMAMACRSIPRNLPGLDGGMTAVTYVHSNLPDLDGMTVADVHSLTPGEQRAYVRGGIVPERFNSAS